MRKFSILDENYMALEQSIAQALDQAAYLVRESKMEVEEVVDEYFTNLEENVVFTKSANFINFRNNELVESYTDIDLTLNNISESVKAIKTKTVFSLEEAAMLSRVLREFDLTETEDEVDELAVFFGGKDNINIPDSKDNDFNVVVSEEGKQIAIENYGKLRSFTNKALEESYRKSIQEGNKERITEALEKLAVLRKTSEILSEGVGVITWLLSSISPIFGGVYASIQVKRIIQNTLMQKESFAKKAEELKDLKAKRANNERQKELIRSMKQDIKTALNERKIVLT
jgi:uncharacterized protein YutE (UPF0331/DUF86 family)